MAEQKNKKVEEQIDNTPIDGQMEIAPEDTAELKVVDETVDTVKFEMPEETTSCADHISRTKVLDVINSTMAKYDGKVVLAMSEVRDIIKAITTAVNE